MMNVNEHEINNNEQQPVSMSNRILAEVWDWTKSILVALVIVFIIHQFVFNLSKVDGHSMQPTLSDGERLFVNRIVYLVGKPDYGDIVILKDPRNGRNQYLVKRVVGAPGDLVEIRNHRLFVNGEQIDEPYTAVKIEGPDFGPLLIGEKQYFVMGDNRHLNDSLDSRDFGAVDQKLIKGRAEFIVWPITRMDKL